MNYRFTKHYSREEARALLPQIREWLAQIAESRAEVELYDKRLSGLTADGQDTGGAIVNKWIRAISSLQSVLLEFERREIFIKDVERGLLDFPAIIGGKEVFLCWEADEDDVEFWHDLETGYGGREKLD
jgi:hypothetical protein